MLTFSNSRSSHKRNRTFKKFPRHKIKDNKSLKELGYCKNNWIDDDYTYIKGNFKKFLMCNIGKPINKVYSKFLKRCDNLGRFNIKEEFYRWIEKKKDIDIWRGGFYITAKGILNYMQPIKAISSKPYSITNKERFDKLDLHNLLKILHETKVPQCLGKYWKYHKELTFYMDYSTSTEESEKFNRRKTAIDGVGYGIDLNIINTQTGKTKYSYSVIDDWLHSYKPIIYFYYLDK